MITAENFWHTDLCEIEKTFLPKDIVITDLPLSQEYFQRILTTSNSTELKLIKTNLKDIHEYI